MHNATPLKLSPARHDGIRICHYPFRAKSKFIVRTFDFARSSNIHLMHGAKVSWSHDSFRVWRESVSMLFFQDVGLGILFVLCKSKFYLTTLDELLSSTLY